MEEQTSAVLCGVGMFSKDMNVIDYLEDLSYPQAPQHVKINLSNKLNVTVKFDPLVKSTAAVADTFPVRQPCASCLNNLSSYLSLSHFSVL